ncbi:MAG: hypothetical protein ACREPN_12335 [Rudaea sp.]
MRLAAALFSALLTPALALAQSIAPASIVPKNATNASTDADVRMPLWGTPDGRILALVALGGSHGAPTMPQAPQIGSAADWQLIDVTNFVGGGLALRLGNRVNAYAKFGRGIELAPLNPAAFSFGCDAGLSFTFNSLCPSRNAVARSGSLSIGTDLHSDHFDIGLDYGLAWRDRGTPTFATVAQSPAWELLATFGDESLPTLAVPALQWANIRDTHVGAQARWRWDDSQSLDLDAALSRIQLDLPGGALMPILNQAALSFGVHSGNFSGTLTGRVLGPADALGNGQGWTSLDLGFSWRAPWRGVFSIGAQNLWSSGNPPLLTDPTHAPDPGQARVPYVQYHQDL